MRWALIALALAGCGAPVPDRPATKPIPFQIDARGVQLLDRPQRIDFGRTDHSAERAMEKLLAKAPSERGSCADGARFVAWPDGTRLIFRNGNFVGWSKGEATSGLVCA